jgi:hypothetical protein
MLVVLSIIAILTSLMAAAVISANDSSNLTGSAYTIAAALQRGRAYAMAHNTYVWVGFYEENADASSTSPQPPPYAGVGRIVIGMVASVDGTDVIDGMAAGPLPAGSIVPIEKLVTLDNVDLNDSNLPLVSSSPLQLAEQTKASTTIASNTSDATSYPLTIGSYTFYKTVRFSPSGESVVNDASTLVPISEIGLRPTHGDHMDQNSPNVAAIRFTGIGGNVHVYRN